MDPKAWNQSRTIIANGVSLVIALATFFAGPELGLDPQVARWAGIVLGVANVVNMWLRTMTVQPIEGTPAARDVRRGLAGQPRVGDAGWEKQ